MRYFDILKRRAERRQDYLDNLPYYRAQIEKFFQAELGDASVRFFGSVLTKTFDAESDVDVLVVSSHTPPRLDARSRLIAELRSRIGFASPFEIHLITEEEYEDWYKNFIPPASESLVGEPDF
jgi:hypothetical protein